MVAGIGFVIIDAEQAHAGEEAGRLSSPTFFFETPAALLRMDLGLGALPRAHVTYYSRFTYGIL